MEEALGRYSRARDAAQDVRAYDGVDATTAPLATISTTERTRRPRREAKPVQLLIEQPAPERFGLGRGLVYVTDDRVQRPERAQICRRQRGDRAQDQQERTNRRASTVPA